MRYLLAPIAAAIVALGCAAAQTKPKPPPLGCRPSGADIQIKGELAKRDMLLCFNPDGTLGWQLGPQKPAQAQPEPTKGHKTTAPKETKTK